MGRGGAKIIFMKTTDIIKTSDEIHHRVIDGITPSLTTMKECICRCHYFDSVGLITHISSCNHRTFVQPSKEKEHYVSIESKHMKNKLILQPRDYVVIHPGLKIQNLSANMMIEIEAPIIKATPTVKYEIDGVV